MQKREWPNFNNKLILKVSNILRSGKINYTTGPFGKEFEKKFSKFVGNKYSIAICNGTAALEVAIKSLKLPKQSEIMVPGRSFFASASCIVNTGHKPIFVDVDLLTQNISIKDIRKKITKKTKAIICVHLAGLPCDMKNLISLAKTKKLKLLKIVLRHMGHRLIKDKLDLIQIYPHGHFVMIKLYQLLVKAE